MNAPTAAFATVQKPFHRAVAPLIALLGRIALLASAAFTACSLGAQPLDITTFAGAESVGSSDGPRAAARYSSPTDVVVDSGGNIYVADSTNSTIRKITPGGVVSTFAGLAGSVGTTDGSGSAARFNGPLGLAVNATTLYVVEGAGRLRKINLSTAAVTTLTGTAGEFVYPTDLVVDSAGNLFVTDASACLIKKVTAAGTVTTFAGTQYSYSHADGTGTAAKFNYPQGIAIDSSGNLYVGDSLNRTIRKITPAAVVTTIAGNPLQGGPSADGTGSVARFIYPGRITVAGDGNVYVADSSDRTIRKVTPAGVVTTLAGSAGTTGDSDGTGTAASFNSPFGIGYDASGNLVVADIGANTLRQITPAGVVTTFSGFPAGSADGTGTAARFYYPHHSTIDSAGNIFVIDKFNATIRKITPAGVVSTFVGSAGQFAVTDGTGSAARFQQLNGIAADASDNLYVSDWNCIRKITSAAVVTTFAGSANTTGTTDGTGSIARFNTPLGLGVDSSGAVYVADSFNQTIRKISPAGVVTTFAGSAGLSGSTDGTGSAARFVYPSAIAVNAANTLYVGGEDLTIRKITSAGVVTTLAGSSASGDGSIVDGAGTVARFLDPYALATDAAGNIFVADGTAVRRVTPAGDVTTVAGGTTAGAADGLGSAARFHNAAGISVNALGTVYISDDAGTIRKGVAPAVSISVQTPWQKVFVGNNAVFNVTSGDATGFQWERSTNGGTTWNALSNGGSFTGVTTATLTVADVSAGMNGWQFRALLSNTNGSRRSIAATLTAIDSSPGFLWGQNQTLLFGSETPRAVAGNVASVVAGVLHTMFIKTDGTLWGMGQNLSGQLGVVTASPNVQSTPVPVATGVTSVAVGGAHTLFIKTDGTLWGMGNNTSGQLGDGTTTSRNSPVQIATGVASVAAGDSHTLFIKTDGTLWAMGNNSSGQLGDGTITPRNSPVQIASGVASVAASSATSSYFVKTDGTLWAMGSNSSGQLGDGTTTSRNSPVQIATGVAAVAAGGSHTLFIKTDGTLWATGNNTSGQLGDGTTTRRLSPVPIATGVVKVSAGSLHTAFIKTNGTVWGMGSIFSLGIDSTSTSAQTTPVSLLDGTVMVSAGSGYTMFLKLDGTLFAAGGNSVGQLGDRQPTPGSVALATDVIAAGADQGFSNLYVKSDGTLWQSFNGLVSPVAGATGVIEAFAGAYSQKRLYLKGDGTLWLLASDGSSTQVASEVITAGAGLNYYLYVKSDGTLWKYGQVGLTASSPDGQVADHVMSVSTAAWHFLFVKENQTLWGMGYTWGGFAPGSSFTQLESAPAQLEVGVVSASASPDAGNQYIKTDGTLWTRGAGWDASAGPAVQVDTGVLSVAGVVIGNQTGSLYLKPDGIMRFRPGVVAPLGGIVEVAGGVLAINKGHSGWFTYIQSAGFGTAPAITVQPQPATLVIGGAATLQVVATGTGPMSYQWFKDGIAISWARAAQYVIPFALAADVGSYTVTITDSAGSTTSVAAQLSIPGVEVAPVITTQPLSQNITVGGPVTLRITASGSPTPTLQWQKNNVDIGGATGSSYMIASAGSGDSGDYTVVATNAAGVTASDAATLAVGTPPAGFDVVGYLARYPDVAAIYGANTYGAWIYYRDVGIYQGEVFDDLFRVEEYLALYPELFAIFGDNLGAALDHWLSTGRIEGKLGRIPLEFSATGYFTRNPDVATAVGNDPILAWGHYWLYGIYEGRAYDEELRVFEYLAINADLTAAFVNDWRTAALHWMRYGRTEGRLGRLPLTFNVTEYLVRSPDVATTWGTNPTTVFLHFWLYGIDEGRTYDDLFRPDEYLALNPDLATALGTDRRLAFKHWVRYGQTEGRPGKYP